MMMNDDIRLCICIYITHKEGETNDNDDDMFTNKARQMMVNDDPPPLPSYYRY